MPRLGDGFGLASNEPIVSKANRTLRANQEKGVALGSVFGHQLAEGR